MTKLKSKIRLWVEKRLIGNMTNNEWYILRGRYSNKQIRSLSREQALRFIER